MSNELPVAHIQHVLSLVAFPGLTFEFSPQRLALRVSSQPGTSWGIDNVAGLDAGWNGRWWLLSVHMTDGEIVQTAFKAVLTALEHECRERFKFQGQAIMDPHYDVYRLVALRAADGALKTRDPAVEAAPKEAPYLRATAVIRYWDV